jgi:hypothetical protein
MAVLPILIMVWAAAGIVALIKGIVAASSSTWSRAFSYFVLPLACIAAFSQPVFFLRNANYIGQVLNFEIMRPAYQARIDALPRTGEPKLVVFNRGGMVWHSEGVVYDESDEVVRPQADRTTAWKLRASNTELGCGYWAGALSGHFYLADFDC